MAGDGIRVDFAVVWRHGGTLGRVPCEAPRRAGDSRVPARRWCRPAGRPLAPGPV